MHDKIDSLFGFPGEETGLLATITIANVINLYKGRKTGSVEPFATFIKKPKVNKVKIMLDEGVAIRQICKVLECSPNFVNKVKDRLKA
ncbi:MAG TPA: hypothetical protein VK462_03985 [Nitrososphaeraceae archaeon]|nr:hypothetical protein [Nitrososphaeraceae archaeon]